MKRTLSRNIIFGVIFAIFFLYAVSLIFPFLWLLNNSFKTHSEFYANVWSFPASMRFVNYSDALTYSFRGTNMLGMFLNSLFITVVSVFLNLFMSTCAAYALAKFDFIGKKLLYNFALILMVVPTIGATAATYKFMFDTNLYDTYLGIFVLTSGGFGIAFMMIHAAFKSISSTYAEAGRIDGANEYTIFFRIMLPQAMPIIATMAVISAIGVWNDYYTPYMYMPSNPTLAVGINEMQTQFVYESKLTSFFAAMLLSVIPVLILFAVFQKQIMDKGVNLGGIKE